MSRAHPCSSARARAVRACVCAVVCAHVGARSPNRGPAPLLQRPVARVLKPALDSVRVCDSDRQRLRSLVAYSSELYFKLGVSTVFVTVFVFEKT